MDAGVAYEETVGGEGMGEEEEKEDVDAHGFTDRDKENLNKVRDLKFDNGPIFLLNKITQNQIGGLTEEGVVIVQTIRDALMTTGIVIDENMISLEMLEWIEVKFTYDGDEKEVLLCRKPSATQGTVLVWTDCKLLVEETAKKFPLPDDVKVDTCDQQLMVFLRTVSEFKQYVYDTEDVGKAQGGKKIVWESQLLEVLQGMHTSLQAGGPSKVGDKAKRYELVVLQQRMKVLKNSFHYTMEESSVPTLEKKSLARMEKVIKGVCPMINTYENDQPEAIKVMKSKTRQEAPRENATLARTSHRRL
jgi:hypothetical protein